jgi:hypothetical protein
MEMTYETYGSAARRPGALDFAAGLLLLGTVILHVVAMMPTYFEGTGSLASQPDEAALYGVLTASWALALVIGLTGPDRTPVAAGLADALHYGVNTVGGGLWLMEAAWLIGAAGAVVAVLAARSRHSRRVREPVIDLPSVDWHIDWAAPVAPAASAPPTAPVSPAAPVPVEPSPTLSRRDPTPAVLTARGGDTTILPVAPAAEDEHERLTWTLLVVVLAALVAGAFLPAWDHAVATSLTTGQSLSRTLGNAFSGPWPQVVGTVAVAVALLVVPIVAVRLRNKPVGAAAVCGGLLVLASQLTSAVVQVDQPVPSADFGISSGQARQAGVTLALRLTDWFTVDALAAYALFAAVMVWATLRVVHDSSPGAMDRAPAWRSEAMPRAS